MMRTVHFMNHFHWNLWLLPATKRTCVKLLINSHAATQDMVKKKEKEKKGKAQLLLPVLHLVTR